MTNRLSNRSANILADFRFDQLVEVAARRFAEFSIELDKSLRDLEHQHANGPALNADPNPFQFQKSRPDSDRVETRRIGENPNESHLAMELDFDIDVSWI